MGIDLKSILKENGVSITRLVELLQENDYKLSRVSISNIINGVHSPKVETLEAIANALDIYIGDLFTNNKSLNKKIRKEVEEGIIAELEVSFNNILSLMKSNSSFYQGNF